MKKQYFISMLSPKVFGILNITPDSFSDGNQFISQHKAIEHAVLIKNNGIDIIDIGAESTRPNADIIDCNIEITRLDGIIQNISYFARVSIDTRNPETAEFACKHNARIINDVSGFSNYKMYEVAARYNTECVFMHSLSVPANKNICMKENDMEMLKTLINWMIVKIESFQKFGIQKDKLIFDPGIGFGKTAEQSMYIINNIEYISNVAHSNGIKILIGHSRKSFLNTYFPHYNINDATNIITNRISQYIDFVRFHYQESSIFK